MSTLLTVKGLTKTYGARRVLADVSFSVYTGEVVGLIGPNGAGKTTVLECLAGLLPETAGSLAHHDRPLPAAQRKDTLFYVPDGILPWPEQSVIWTLQFFEKLYRRGRDRVAAVAATLHLNELSHARVATLSKGERKRLLLALALLTPQPLLLLDEPFDGLDLRQTREVMTLLKDESSTGRSLLLSIHQLNDAARVCDRLILLNAGECVAEGRLVELQEQANLTDGGLEEIFLALT